MLATLPNEPRPDANVPLVDVLRSVARLIRRADRKIAEFATEQSEFERAKQFHRAIKAHLDKTVWARREAWIVIWDSANETTWNHHGWSDPE